MKAVLKSTLSDPMLENGDFYERVRVFLNCYIDFLIENKEILPVMEKNLSSCIKHLPEFYDSEIADIYRSIIDRMVSLGYTPDNAHITTLIIVDMTGNVCSDAIMYEKPFPIEKIRDIVVSSAISIIRNNARLTRGEIRETLN